MSLMVWLSLLLICMLGAMSPGPSLAVVLRQTVSNGRGHGIATGCAHAIGVGAWAAATVWGLGVLVSQHETLFTALTWAGAAYLVGLGINALRFAATPELQVKKGAQETFGQAARSGLLIALLNPKLAVFFTALFSQFVTAGQGLEAQLIMVLTAAVVDGLWYTLVALLFSQSHLLAWLRRHLKRIEQLTGVVLIGLAIQVVIS